MRSILTLLQSFILTRRFVFWLQLGIRRGIFVSLFVFVVLDGCLSFLFECDRTRNTGHLFNIIFLKSRPFIAQMFSIMHRSISDESKKMFAEIRRNNYVTPTNFLELTSGYKK